MNVRSIGLPAMLAIVLYLNNTVGGMLETALQTTVGLSTASPYGPDDDVARFMPALRLPVLTPTCWIRSSR
jgi:hypothetical protein